MSDVISSLAHAVVQAISRDLNPIVMPEYRFERTPGKAGTTKVDTGETKEVRPRGDLCDVYHFPQTWGSTALGFPGIGGQAITRAYTTVVIGPQGDACVYFNGRLAYHVHRPSSALYEDIAAHRMSDVVQHSKYVENR